MYRFSIGICIFETRKYDFFSPAAGHNDNYVIQCDCYCMCFQYLTTIYTLPRGGGFPQAKFPFTCGRGGESPPLATEIKLFISNDLAELQHIQSNSIDHSASCFTLLHGGGTNIIVRLCSSPPQAENLTFWQVFLKKKYVIIPPNLRGMGG